MVVSAFHPLRVPTDIMRPAVKHDARKFFAIESLRLISVGENRVRTHLRPEVRRRWRQLTPTRVSLHFGLDTNWAHAIFAAVCHEVPKTFGFRPETGFLFWELS